MQTRIVDPALTETEAEDFITTFEHICDDYKSECDCEFVVRPPTVSPEKDIIKACSEYDANIVVLGARKKGVLER